MCDERTASRFTAFSTAKRNGLTGEHIIQMAQLQQHWTYGLEAPSYSHQAHLKLPKKDTHGQIQLPTPKLADLLNPSPANEDIIFNQPDPYDLDVLIDPDDEVDDSDANNTDSMPHIIRGGSRLDIEGTVDLLNKNLVDRFDGKPTAPKPVEKQKTGKPLNWQPENYDANTVDF